MLLPAEKADSALVSLRLSGGELYSRQGKLLKRQVGILVKTVAKTFYAGCTLVDSVVNLSVIQEVSRVILVESFERGPSGFESMCKVCYCTTMISTKADAVGLQGGRYRPFYYILYGIIMWLHSTGESD